MSEDQPVSSWTIETLKQHYDTRLAEVDLRYQQRHNCEMATTRICKIDGCKGKHRSLGWCNMHYRRWRTHGDPNVEIPQGFQPGNAYAKTSGFQPGHPDYGTQFRPGPDSRRGSFSSGRDPNRAIPRSASANPAWKGCGVSYTAAHFRVRAKYGKASLRKCVDCGKQARHWSYNRLDPNHLSETRGGCEMYYSPDPDFYEPRCQPCHIAFDAVR